MKQRIQKQINALTRKVQSLTLKQTLNDDLLEALFSKCSAHVDDCLRDQNSSPERRFPLGECSDDYLHVVIRASHLLTSTITLRLFKIENCLGICEINANGDRIICLQDMKATTAEIVLKVNEIIGPLNVKDKVALQRQLYVSKWIVFQFQSLAIKAADILFKRAQAHTQCKIKMP